MALDTCRSIGMSTLGPIPWTAAESYCQRLGFEPDDAAILWAVIHRADTAFRAEISKRD